MATLALLYGRLRAAGTEPGDSDDLRLKKTVLLFTCGLMIAAAGIWLALYKMMGLPVSASLPFAFQMVSFGTLVIYLYTLNFDVFRVLQLGLILFVPFMVQWSIGNFVTASGVILWGLLAPVGAVIVYSARDSAPWFFAYIFFLLLTGYVDYDLAAMPPKGPKVPLSTSIVFFALNFAAMSTLVYSLLRFASTEREKSRLRLEQAHALLADEQQKSERLLLNVLPARIAERLKHSDATIADGFAEATVMFADIVGFTHTAARLPPVEIFDLVNGLFSAFDALAERHGVERIKTIGDAYMIAGGLNPGELDFCAAVADLALDMRELTARDFSVHGQPLELRIGIASGPVVAGVVGRRKFIYDVWGDAVNVASRITAENRPGVIQVDALTHERLAGRYDFQPMEILNLKGKGDTQVYRLDGRRGAPGSGRPPAG
jgi:adenylate cyclase